MSAYRVSLANRRIIFLAVLSLIASLLTVNFNAPVARANAESIFFTDASSSVAEDVSGGTHPVEVTLTYTDPLQGNVSAEVEVDGASTATEGDDFSVAPPTVAFTGSPASGATTDITITLTNDGTYEGDETIVLNLINPAGGTVGSTFATHTITITDDEAKPVISVAATLDVSEDAVNAAVLVSKSGADTEDQITFEYGTTDTGSASGGGTDFTDTSASGAITPTGTDTTIQVPINNDLIDEGDETFTFTISSPSSNATLGNPVVTITILDDDDPGLVISDAPAVTEGANAVFSISRGGGSNAQSVSVTATTSDIGSATEGSGGSADYDGKFEIVTLGIGVDAVDFTVVTTDDGEDEGQETFEVDLSLPSGATIATGTATGTINDDDDPEFSIADAGAVAEGVTASFTVTRSGSAALPVSVTATAVSGAGANGADVGDDFTATSQILSFGSGVTSLPFDVPTINDDDHEPTEDFTAELSAPSGGTIAAGTGTALITDTDDVEVSWTLANSTVAENVAGGTHSATLTLTVPGGGTLQAPVTVEIPAPTGSATGGGTDYSIAGSPITIPAGTASGPVPGITLTVNNDTDHEPSETVVMAMTVTSGPATVVAPTGHTVTITDNDDATVSWTVAASSVAENVVGGTHSPTLTLTVPGGGALAAPVTVTVPTPTGSATGGGVDYSIAGSPIIIPAGTSSGPLTGITLTINDDAIVDPAETVIMTMSVTGGPATAIAPTGHTVTITDNESPGLSIVESSGSTVVNESGTTDSFTVALSLEPAGTVTVSLAEALATDEFDITSPLILTFTTTNWDTGQPVAVRGNNDVDIDGDQIGRVDLTAAGPGYGGVTNQVLVSIVDNDTATYSFSPTTADVTEGGATDTYTVVLDARPTSSVTVNLATDGEVTVAPTSVVFTTSNWLTPRTITVTAVNDNLVDGTTTDTVLHTASSGDSDFDGIVGGVGVSVTDNDQEGFNIDVGSALAVIEGGDSDTYSIALTAEPLNDVTVTITPDEETTVSPGVLTFTPSSWNDARVVTVTAVDDGVPETPPQTSDILHAASSDDPIFDGMTETVVAEIGDAGALLTSLEGPTKGAPGHEAVFEAMLNAGGVGPVEYAWTAFYLGNPIDTGEGSTFRFTPDTGGAHQIQVIVSDDNGQQPADFIVFTSLGDSGDSVFVGDIVWLAEEGITRGCNPPANDLFCPNDFVTREQMAAFLVRFLGLTDNGGGNKFVDDNGSIFENDIARLAAAGITKGCNPPVNDRFCPTDRVSREQMAAFLVRALGLTDNGGGNKFTDDNGSIFENDIAKLAAAGITKGCNPPANTQFCPTDSVTRGQMAAFLRRADAILSP